MTKARRKIKVYTKTGDAGESSLYNMERLPKVDQCFCALGDADELNAHVGLAREHCIASKIDLEEKLAEIQSRLLDVGSAIATPLDTSTETQLKRAAFRGEEHTATLEEWIDTLDKELPPLKNFILPGGGFAAAQLHVARTVCRRAERRVVGLVNEGRTPASVRIYLNRLSDFFFVAARYATQISGHHEVVYKKIRQK